jgi:hypothetical protein
MLVALERFQTAMFVVLMSVCETRIKAFEDL